MHWIAPSEKDTANGTLEKHLWDTADQYFLDEFAGSASPPTGKLVCEISSGENPSLDLTLLNPNRYA